MAGMLLPGMNPTDHLLAAVLGILGLTVASTLAVLDKLPLLTDALIGAGAGVLIGKLLAYRLERRRGELPARRVRQIEWTWTVVGIVFAVGLFVVIEGVG